MAHPTSAALGISKSVDILHHIRSLPTPQEQLEASDKIKAIERRAMQHQEPQPGLVDLMEYLREKEVKRALCTRNFEYFTFPTISLRLLAEANGMAECLL